MIIMMMANIAVWFSVKLSWLFSLTLSEHIKMYWNRSKTNIIQHYTRNNKYPSNRVVDAAADPNILSFPLPPCASMSHSEKDSLEKLLSGLQQEVDSQHAELEALRASALELQRQRDLLRQQREDLETQLARQRTEAQRGYSKSEGEWPLHNTHTFRHPWLFSSKLFRVQISNTCHSRPAMHPDDIWMKIQMIYFVLLHSHWKETSLHILQGHFCIKKFD